MTLLAPEIIDIGSLPSLPLAERKFYQTCPVSILLGALYACY